MKMPKAKPGSNVGSRKNGETVINRKTLRKEKSLK
jgi:hypothetical protein